MNNKNKITYGPHQRDYLEQAPRELKSCSEKNKDSCSKLPDPVQDPIVSNNIANVEFNYTYNGFKDILGEDNDSKLDK
ncbi:hypothetical protein [Clostridium amazonitimonense]|uniref:hypothetical protein n=1 Tax=Clostridium amazonitimonense TaxID=1499689 RepID=UPI000509D991|nr:hypothetical protein [Clostridium amazonitimonense]